MQVIEPQPTKIQGPTPIPGTSIPKLLKEFNLLNPGALFMHMHRWAGEYGKVCCPLHFSDFPLMEPNICQKRATSQQNRGPSKSLAAQTNIHVMAMPPPLLQLCSCLPVHSGDFTLEGRKSPFFQCNFPHHHASA
jgi:hypothetical protein